MGKILITPKINPDLDGVACAYSYAKLLNSYQDGNEYIAGIYGQPHIEARFLLGKLGIENGITYKPKNEFDKFIIVDASDMKGMPEIIRERDVIEVIDHREVHEAEKLFPNAKIQIELVGAAATLILEKILSSNHNFEQSDLLLLYGAIFSNTLNFKSSIVNERDINAVRFIEQNLSSQDFKDVINEMFITKTEYIKNNLEEVITEDLKIFDINAKLGIIQLEGFDLNVILENKNKEIKNILKKIKKDNDLDYIFLTAADVENGYNIFFIIDDNTKMLLEKKMGLLFNSDATAKNSQLLLRKQILPLLI